MSKKNLSLIKVLAINSELQSLLSEKLNISAKWDISKVITQCEKHAEDYNKFRLELCEKHGKLNASKDQYIFEEGKEKGFKKELEELNDKKVSLNVSISFTKFDKIETEFPYHHINLLR
jgi:hypothetical protein